MEPSSMDSWRAMEHFTTGMEPGIVRPWYISLADLNGNGIFHCWDGTRTIKPRKSVNGLGIFLFGYMEGNGTLHCRMEPGI
jgi:hypothetical protein